MVSLRETSRKYRGRKAETYEEIRTKQARWHLENEAVRTMLRNYGGGLLLDCPVGTGRFIPLYREYRIERVIGVDASEEMLALARAKVGRRDQVQLEVGSALEIPLRDREASFAVCVRFLDLIDDVAMRAVMRELFRVTMTGVILTIRLGDEYVPKVNTATHSRPQFLRYVAGLGWRVEHEVPIFEAGWVVMRLGRK